MSSFENILKKAKDAVVETYSSKDDELKKYLAAILYYLQYANELYEDIEEHNIQFDFINCSKCNKASYSVTIAEIDDEDKIVSYNQGTWECVK